MIHVKRESKVLLQKALDSLVLSIEHFNRPWDRGRHEAVLILLDRSFELFLKAAIPHRGGKIREARAAETIGFDRCVRKAVTEVGFLTEEEALTIQIVNSLRDAAQHYILEISEQQLYVYTQAAVSLFDRKLKEIFGKRLSSYIPERVLPVSTTPPKPLEAIVEAEFKDIKALVAPGSRKRLQAMARLRSLAIVEASLTGVRSQPSEGDLKRLTQKISAGESWKAVFPGVSTLSLSTEGTGLTVSLRITKKEGEAVHLVPEGTPGATVVAIKRVNELDFYSLSLTGLAEKVGLSTMRTLALIYHANLQGSDEYYKEITVGKTHFRRYSSRAIDKLKAELETADMDEVWAKHKQRLTRRARHTSTPRSA